MWSLFLPLCLCPCSKRNQLGDFYAWNACLSHILNLAKVGGLLGTQT